MKQIQAIFKKDPNCQIWTLQVLANVLTFCKAFKKHPYYQEVCDITFGDEPPPPHLDSIVAEMGILAKKYVFKSDILARRSWSLDGLANLAGLRNELLTAILKAPNLNQRTPHFLSRLLAVFYLVPFSLLEFKELEIEYQYLIFQLDGSVDLKQHYLKKLVSVQDATSSEDQALIERLAEEKAYLIRYLPKMNYLSNFRKIDLTYKLTRHDNETLVWILLRDQQSMKHVNKALETITKILSGDKLRGPKNVIIS